MNIQEVHPWKKGDVILASQLNALLASVKSGKAGDGDGAQRNGPVMLTAKINGAGSDLGDTKEFPWDEAACDNTATTWGVLAGGITSVAYGKARELNGGDISVGTVVVLLLMTDSKGVAYWGIIGAIGGTPATVVSSVQIDAANLLFQKKTISVIALGAESGWTNWHEGVVCGPTENTEAFDGGENVTAFSTTMALIHLTGAL